MIIATTENIAGHRVVNTLGQAFGVVMRSRGIGGTLVAGLRSIIGGEIIAGTLFERTFYKPVRTQAPGPGWTRTKEKFIDPATGKTVEVFYNAASGERQYVSPESDRR